MLSICQPLLACLAAPCFPGLLEAIIIRVLIGAYKIDLRGYNSSMTFDTDHFHAGD